MKLDWKDFCAGDYIYPIFPEIQIPMHIRGTKGTRGTIARLLTYNLSSMERSNMPEKPSDFFYP